MFMFQIHGISDNITHSSVHLDDSQIVFYREVQEDQAIARAAHQQIILAAC